MFGLLLYPSFFFLRRASQLSFDLEVALLGLEVALLGVEAGYKQVWICPDYSLLFLFRPCEKPLHDLLISAYRCCLELAVENNCRSIAFPAISTGVYGYPIDLAAEQSLHTVRAFLVERQRPELVRFVLFGAGASSAFARVLEAMVV